MPYLAVWFGLGITGAAIILSPLLGFCLALALVLAVSWIFVRSTPVAVNNTFGISQFVSASLYSLGHGGNDAQKTMGIIAVLLYSQRVLGEEFYIPVWGYPELSGSNGARHFVRRLAHRSHHGIENHPLASCSRLQRRPAVRRRCSWPPSWGFRFPRPYDHRSDCRRRSCRKDAAVRWNVAGNVVTAWILTMPAAALMGASVLSSLQDMAVTSVPEGGRPRIACAMAAQ